MCDECRGHLAKDQDELAELRGFDLVEALAIDEFHQELATGDLEPGLFLPEVVDLGDGRMVQLLGGFIFGLGLLDVDVFLGLILAHDLERITLAAGRLVADQEDLAARAGAKLIDDAILHSGKLGRTRHVRHSGPRSIGCS